MTKIFSRLSIGSCLIFMLIFLSERLLVLSEVDSRLTSALQLVLGAGDVGAALTGDPRIGGVIFTGSTEVA